MITIEDTHLTLIGILSKVEANNSLIFLRLQTYEKEFAEFPFLFTSIIPCRILEVFYYKIDTKNKEQVNPKSTE